jgi:hypothetical protein
MCNSEQNWLRCKKKCVQDLKRVGQHCPEVCKCWFFSELTSSSKADIFPSKGLGFAVGCCAREHIPACQRPTRQMAGR